MRNFYLLQLRKESSHKFRITRHSLSRWPAVKRNSFPGISKGFSAKFWVFSRGFLTMLSKIKLSHTDLPPVPIHLSFYVLLEILCPLLGKETAYHTTNEMLFLPTNNLINSPPQRYRNKECNSTARPKIDAWKICFRT